AIGAEQVDLDLLVLDTLDIERDPQAVGGRAFEIAEELHHPWFCFLADQSAFSPSVLRRTPRKRGSPWALTTSSSTDLRPLFTISAMRLDTSSGVETSTRPTSTMTSPG